MMKGIKIPSLEGRNELRITGRVASTETSSGVLTDPDTGKKFVEIMRAGVFISGIKNNSYGDIYANLNHGREKKGSKPRPGMNRLGSINDSTLNLYEDANGLYSKLNIKKDKFHLLKDSKLFQGWSFEFGVVDEDRWIGDNGIETRYVKDIVLKGVTLLDDRNPPGAYNATTVHVRDSSGEEERVCFRDISSEDIWIDDFTSEIENLRTKARKFYFSWRFDEILKNISK